MKKTRAWKESRHTAHVQKRVAKAQKRVKKQRNRIGGAVIGRVANTRLNAPPILGAGEALQKQTSVRNLPPFLKLLNRWQPEPVEKRVRPFPVREWKRASGE